MDWPPLLIRADGGEDIGLGHVLRTMALGSAWRERGGRVEFLGRISSAAVRRRVEAELGACEEILTDPGTGTDLDVVLARARAMSRDQDSAPWVLLDGYSFNADYHRAIMDAGCRLIVVDDTAHHSFYAADVVLNQNLYAESVEYRCAPHSVLLLGTRYVLLRPEFRRLAPCARPTPAIARRILVTMGGSDPVNATATVLRALDYVDLDGLDVIVLIGPANPHRGLLQEVAAASNRTVQFLDDPEDIPSLMGDADLAITAGGSTCWELAYVGVPFVVLTLAENQVDVAASLEAIGGAVHAGWHSSVDPRFLGGKVQELCQDQSARDSLRMNAVRLVDGRGADRVLAVVAGLSATAEELLPVVRRAAWEDRFQLWRLANDSLLRANSFDRTEIELDHHVDWFRTKLADPANLHLVLDVGGVVAAQVRYEREDPDRAAVHFGVAQAFRGKGLGTQTLQRTWSLARQELGVCQITGVVMKGNVPSERAFRSAGYQMVREDEIRGLPCSIFQLDCELS